jgi:signal transduction histidine kinase
VFVVVAQLDVWMPWGDGGDHRGFDDPLWVSSALMLAATAPLAWRRRWPLPTAGVLIGALVVEVAFVSPTATFVGGFITVLVAGYTVAAYEPAGRAALGFAMLGSGVLAVTLSVPELRSWSDVPFELLCVATAWLFGRLVHRLRTRAHTLAEHAEQLERLRDEQAHAAVTLERTRIARELHDVIAHSVSLMGVQAAAAEQVLALDPERAREPLRAIQETARDAIDELRRLLGVLRESDENAALVPQPGLGSLSALVEQMRGAGLPVELTVEGDPTRLSAGVELSAYRVIQEALTNTLKHAGPVQTSVTVRHRPDGLDLEIADGGGRDGNGDGTGHGLIGMRERVALYGGTLTMGHRDDGGYSVRASLPTHAGRT